MLSSKLPVIPCISENIKTVPCTKKVGEKDSLCKTHSAILAEETEEEMLLRENNEMWISAIRIFICPDTNEAELPKNIQKIIKEKRMIQLPDIFEESSMPPHVIMKTLSYMDFKRDMYIPKDYHSTSFAFIVDTLLETNPESGMYGLLRENYFEKNIPAWITAALVHIGRRAIHGNLKSKSFISRYKKRPGWATFFRYCEGNTEAESGCTSSTPFDIFNHQYFKPLLDETTLNIPTIMDRTTSPIQPSEIVHGRLRNLLSICGPAVLEVSDMKTYDNASICLAGGSVSACHMPGDMYRHIVYGDKYNGEALHGEITDLDFFITGSSEEEKKKLCERVLKTFVAFGMRIEHYGSVFQIRGLDRDCQVIMSECSDVMELLSQFDMSHIQCAYVCKSVVSTPAFKLFTPYHQTLLSKSKFSGYRLLKAMFRGFVPVRDDRVYSITGSYNGNITYDSYLSISEKAFSEEAKQKWITEQKEHLAAHTKKTEGWEFRTDMRLEKYWNDIHAVGQIVDESGTVKRNDVPIYQKNKHIPWMPISSLNFDDAIEELLSDIPFINNAFKIYQNAQEILPWFHNIDAGSKDFQYEYRKLMIRECRVVPGSMKQVDGKKIYSAEGILHLNPCYNIDHPSIRERVIEKYTEHELKDEKYRKSVRDRLTPEFEHLRSEIRNIYISGQHTSKKNRKLLTQYKNRVDSIQRVLSALNNNLNPYIPDKIEKRDLYHVASTIVDSKSRGPFHTDESINRDKLTCIPQSELPGLLFAHSKEKRYSFSTKTSFGIVYMEDKAVRVTFDFECSSYPPLFIESSDGFKYPIDALNYMTDCSFNMVLYSNIYDWVIPEHSHDMKTNTLYAYGDDIKEEVKDLVNKEFNKHFPKGASTLLSKGWEDFTKSLGSNSFEEKVAKKVCRKKHAEPGLLGIAPTFQASSIYLIPK